MLLSPHLEFMEQVDAQGFVVIENVLSRETCKHFKKLLEALYLRLKDHYPSPPPQQDGLNNKINEKIVFNLHNKSVDFMQLISHSATLPIIGHMLQQGSYQSNEPFIYTGSSGRSPLPGGVAQQLHIDSRVPGSHLTLQAQCLWMLDDFTSLNGATRVVPGSHKRKEYADNGVVYSDELTVTGPAGSVIIFNGGLWHAGGKNQSSYDRWGVIVSYARWFYKQTYRMTENTPCDIFDQLTEDQKKLLGFDTTPSLDEFSSISMRSKEIKIPKQFYTLSY